LNFLKINSQLGVAANKIMRMTLNSGDHIKTWRFSTMKVKLDNQVTYVEYMVKPGFMF
jgi:hypothetical protein